MRRPKKPPKETLPLTDADRFMRVMTEVRGPAVRGKYVHWDKLRHLQPPVGVSREEWWCGLKFHRSVLLKDIPLLDDNGRPFQYTLSDPTAELLHRIDQNAAGHIAMPEPIANPDTRDRYIVSSLMEEAFRSSQLEGAATTRQDAKDMIRSGRRPRDKHERMILNNYATMQRIRSVRNEALSEEMILELHRSITKDTLRHDADAGRFRRADDRVDVADMYGEVFHVPPPAEQIQQRVAALCDFANGTTSTEFIHPVLRAIILHFWLAYDHPFVDGNGRCARALFYWSMLRQDYWLCEYLAISQIITRAPVKYARAFLYTETDDNDLTYFIHYHLDVLIKAIDALHAYIQRKTEELQTAEKLLKTTLLLNHRQRALISHALRNAHAEYSIASHQRSHNVAYQTARTDLLNLAESGLLVTRKRGRRFYFQPTPAFDEKLSGLDSSVL